MQTNLHASSLSIFLNSDNSDLRVGCGELFVASYFLSVVRGLRLTANNPQHHKIKEKQMKKLLLALIILLAGVSFAYGGCVDTFGIGSKATALGGAYSAYADDPYAVYYNPAGLTQLDGQIMSFGVHMIDPNIEVENYQVSNTNDPLIRYPKNFSDESRNLYAPHLGYAAPISDKFALGIAAYAPWGLEVKWDGDPEENPAAYNFYHSYYVREVVTPTFAYKVSDKLSFGFGVSLGKSKAGEERKGYLTPDMGGDPVLGPVISRTQANNVAEGIANVEAGNQASGGLVAPITTTTAAYQFLEAYSPGSTAEIATFKGLSQQGLETPEQVGAYAASSLRGVPAVDHGSHVDLELDDNFNYSFNFGVMYRPSDTVTLGLTYRSRTSTEFEGELKKTRTELDENGIERKIEEISDATLEYDHPEQIQLGVRYVPKSNRDLSFEIDLVWTRWSINDVQNLYMDPGLNVYLISDTEPYALRTESLHRRDWEDTKQVRVGVEWKATDIVTLRAGYFYDPSPIPDDTLELMWPDADKKTYSLGCGLNFGKFSVDSVFQYADIEKARYISGESENFNESYTGTGIHKEVSASADGNMWGLGLTFNYKF